MEEKKTTLENTAAGSGAGNQVYMGTPAGVILCVNGLGEVDDPYDLDAYLWHGYKPDATRVTVPEHMLDEMESLFDLINYPRATTSLRSFSEDSDVHPQGTGTRPGNPSNVPRHLSDSELLQKRGDLGTFIIRVQQRANSSWQGRITWVEKNRTLKFRTVIEMVKLIEAATESASDARQ